MTSNLHTENINYLLCFICNEQFSDEQLFKDHQSTQHSLDIAYTCKECNLTFTTASLFRLHNQRHKSLEKPNCEINKRQKNVCLLCNEMFETRGELKVHITSHKDEIGYKCPICLKYFCNVASVKNHIVVHTGDKPYCCEYCGRRFAQRNGLYAHKQRQHKQNMKEKSTPIIKQIAVPTRAGPSNIVCLLCSISFQNQADLKKHRKTNHLDQITQPNNYQCSECWKIFKTTALLKRHMVIHTGEKPYKCTQCNKSFAQKNGLTQHQQRHNGYKPHKCKFCNKSFFEIHALRLHTNTHTNNRPYVCKEIGCNKAFKESGALTKHYRQHTGERPYKCKQCQQSFSTKSTYNSHCRIHSGEKRYLCNICGKSFTTSSVLKAHINRHNGKKPYNCKICRLVFTDKKNLIAHSNLHSAIDKYKCRDCGKTFKHPCTFWCHRKKQHPFVLKKDQPKKKFINQPSPIVNNQPLYNDNNNSTNTINNHTNFQHYQPARNEFCMPPMHSTHLSYVDHVVHPNINLQSYYANGFHQMQPYHPQMPTFHDIYGPPATHQYSNLPPQ